MPAELRLRRGVAFGLEMLSGPFEVALDGLRTGTIGKNETFEAAIEEGHHTVRLRSGRYSSRDHSVRVLDDEVATFRRHSAALWPFYVVSLVKPDRAIWVRHLFSPSGSRATPVPIGATVPGGLRGCRRAWPNR